MRVMSEFKCEMCDEYTINVIVEAFEETLKIICDDCFEESCEELPDAQR